MYVPEHYTIGNGRGRLIKKACFYGGLFSYTADEIILLNFIFTGLHGYQITQSLSTNKQWHRLLLLKTLGDTYCTNPSLSST